MAFLYPWGNTQELNLDWILQKIKELEAGGSGGGASLDEVANALISASYAVQAYDRSDIVFRDGKLYRANQAIPAPGEAWTPAHWDEILLGDTVSNLVQYVAALSNDQIVNSSSVSGDHTSDALDTLKNAIDAITLDSDSVSNESQVTGDNVSDALDNLNGAIEDVADDLADEVTARANANDTILSSVAYVEETNTATRTYAVGDYVYIKQYERLYRITTATPSGTTLVGHIQYMVNGGLNDVPFAVPIAVQAVSNAYIDLTATHSFFYIYKFGSIYVGKFRLGTLTQIPTGTADFRIAACSLPFALSDDAYFNIVPTGSGGTMQLKISPAGNVYCSNYSGKDAAGFYNGSFIAM